MKAPGLVFSDAAIADILDQSDWYAGKAGRSLAKRWEAGVTATLLQIARGPGTGSPCKFGAEELRGTRRMFVARFPKHLIFYQVREKRNSDFACRAWCSRFRELVFRGRVIEVVSAESKPGRREPQFSLKSSLGAQHELAGFLLYCTEEGRGSRGDAFACA